jgi:hypothetical protein
MSVLPLATLMTVGDALLWLNATVPPAVITTSALAVIPPTEVPVPVNVAVAEVLNTAV